jgi:hypothetical protein
MTTKPVLQKILKATLHTDWEDKCDQENTGKINFTRGVNKQMMNKKESSITKNRKSNCYISLNVDLNVNGINFQKFMDWWIELKNNSWSFTAYKSALSKTNTGLEQKDGNRVSKQLESGSK